VAIKQFDFLKDTLKLVTGTVIAQAIPLLLQPVLTRMYLPADYAVFGLYFSILSWFDVVSTGRYELVVNLPEKDEDAAGAVAGGMWVALGFFALLYIAAYLLHDHITLWLKNPGLSPYLFFIPPVLLVMAWGKMLNAWLVRKKQFRASAVNKVLQKTGEAAVNLPSGLAGFHGGLVFGDIAGRCAQTASAWYQGVKSGFSFSLASPSQMRQVMKRYRQYPLYNMVPALLNTSATLFPVMIISSKFSPEISGWYNFSRLILLVPISFIAYSVSQVLFQRVTSNRNLKLPVRDVVHLILRNLGLMAGILFAAILMAGPWLFTLFFGDAWTEAGSYSRVMIFSFALQLLVTPLSITLAAMEKIRLYSLWQIGYFLAIGSLFFVGGLGIYSFLILLTGIEVFFYLLYLFLILKVVSQYEKTTAS
jgi:O-antigen/teichoic acid export membrane protein